MSDTIVPIPGSEPLPANSLQLIERRDVFRQHAGIVLDDHERVVRCADCAKVFDPFTFLRDQAGHI